MITKQELCAALSRRCSPVGAGAAPGADLGRRRQDRRAHRHVRPLRRPVAAPGSVVAAKMAIDDFGGKRRRQEDRDRLGRPPEQARRRPRTSPASGSTSRRRRRDRRPADSSTSRWRCRQVAREKNKVVLISGAGLVRPHRQGVLADPVHWTYDTYALANGTGGAMVKAGGNSWFFLTADYAFGHALERDTAGGREGGRRQGARRGAPSAQHRRLLLLPAAGAGVQGARSSASPMPAATRSTRSSRRPSSASSRAARSSPAC